VEPVEPGAKGAQKTIKFDLSGIFRRAHATICRLDDSHGDTLDAWKKMGSPKHPTQKQIEELRQLSETGPRKSLPFNIISSL
jgi:xylan 1,4-beta-xylosidase